jgi:hypothetical protein
MKRPHLPIWFPFHVVAPSAVRCAWDTAGEAPPHLRPLSREGARGEVLADTSGPRRASLKSGVFSWNISSRASRTPRRRTRSPRSPRAFVSTHLEFDTDPPRLSVFRQSPGPGGAVGSLPDLPEKREPAKCEMAPHCSSP